MKRRGGNGPIGVDIGGSSVKLLQLVNRDGRPAIQAAARFELPAESADPMERVQTLHDGLAKALSHHAFRGTDCVAALGCADFQMKSIRLPRMPPEELASAVEFEARERFNTGDGGEFRFIPAGEVRHGNDLKEEIIVFAAREGAVQETLQLLESLKLRPIAVDLTPCAMARSFVRFLRRAEDATAVNVFVDVGWQNTAIAMTRGTDLCFLKILDVGGRSFSTAVAQALSLTLPEARDLRIRIIRENSGRRNDDQRDGHGDLTNQTPAEIRARASDAVRPLVERIARDVQLCLRYFAVTFRGNRPESLTFVGGEAHEPALMEIIAPTLDVPCMIGYPLRGMDGTQEMSARDARTLAPCWAVACGLALRGTPWVGGPRPKAGTRAPEAAAV